MHTNPLSRGERIGWGAIKTHCTAMGPVAANRRPKFTTPLFFERIPPPEKCLRVPKANGVRTRCAAIVQIWEVLNGVGVDGVGVIFPFFLRIFPLFLTHFFPFSTHFSPLLFLHAFFSASPKGQGQTTAIYCKNGEFHSDPVCTDPVQNFPSKSHCGSTYTTRSIFSTAGLLWENVSRQPPPEKYSKLLCTKVWGYFSHWPCD